MLVDLDIHELWYLLERCLHGSHLRSDTIERFVNEFYDKLSEHQRMNLFEWAVRLGYSWYCETDSKHFEPSSTCCEKDIIFMKRYHPENQYIVTMKYRYKNADGKWHRKTERVRAFKMDGEYYIDSHRRCAQEFIASIEHIDLHDMWEEHKVKGIDYDTNILEPSTI